jgi:hypothetical protein
VGEDSNSGGVDCMNLVDTNLIPGGEDVGDALRPWGLIVRCEENVEKVMGDRSECDGPTAKVQPAFDYRRTWYGMSSHHGQLTHA